MGDQIPRITAAEVATTPVPGGTETAMAQKTPDTAQTFPTVEPDLGKGVTVQAEPNGAPAKPSFMLSQDPDVTFKGLNARNTLLAQQMASSVKRNLTLLYNDKKLENPEAVAGLEFPEFPTTGNPGFFTKVFRQGMLGMQYNGALSDYEVVCTDLLNGVGRQTIVNEVRAVGKKVDEVDAKVDELRDIALSDLAATLQMREEMLFGLNQVYSMIDTGTNKILTAVDANGNRVIRSIENGTGKIIDIVLEESENIQLTDIMLTDIILEEMNDQFEDLTDLNNANTRVINANIKTQGELTRRAVNSDGDYTRKVVRGEHGETRDVIDDRTNPFLNFLDPTHLWRNR